MPSFFLKYLSYFGQYSLMLGENASFGREIQITITRKIHFSFGVFTRQVMNSTIHHNRESVFCRVGFFRVLFQDLAGFFVSDLGYEIV